MDSFFNLQIGKFAEAAKPTWFDWLSFIFNLIAIISGYLIARLMFKTEIRHQKKLNEQLVLAESEIFKISLRELKNACDNQATKIGQYIEREDFVLEFDQGVNVDFLKFFDIKNLYEKIGFTNQAQITQLNGLLSSLYTLNDFSRALTNELRTYIDKYNYHKEDFYIYRKVLYSEYYKLCNARSVDINNEGGIKKYRFNVDDLFMQKYAALVSQTLNDIEIVQEGSLVSIDNLVAKFIKPLLEETSKFIPEDFDAININNLSNQVNAAYIDMTKVDESHFRVIDSYKQNLEIISSKINSFMMIL